MNPEITIIDDLHPEDDAMLQALQSRSPASVEKRLEKVRKVGSGQFMDKFYVGYGDKSIGDCGDTTIYIEGVTMLCAKAIQDWPLYRGQEASTRYMDFSQALFHDPIGTPESRMVHERWRAFYLRAGDPLRAHLRATYPRQDDEEQKIYDRAINARAFDVLRAFLPAGAVTNLSWKTDLRQARDHLSWLVVHPDPEIREVCRTIHQRLEHAYPHSFRPIDPTDRRLQFHSDVLQRIYYLGPTDVGRWFHTNLDRVDVTTPMRLDWFPEDIRELLAHRPRGVEVPWFLSEYGSITSRFLLDFGSFRDLQRHRNGIIRMPLLTTELGFHPWYLEQLPTDLRRDAVTLLAEQEWKIEGLGDPVSRQNYVSMGYRVACRVTQGLPGFVYRLELRSSKTVHPTLRMVVLEEIRKFRGRFPDFALHVDEDPDSWTVRRGKQTIEERS